MLSKRHSAIVALILLLAPAPLLAATPPALQADQSPSMPDPGGKGLRGGGKLGGFLSPQQRAMLLMQVQDQAKNMDQAQKQAFRKDQVKKLLSMSTTEREKFRAGLQARWDALPAGQKSRLQQCLARQQTGNAQ